MTISNKQTDWLERSRPKRIIQLTNIRNKIGGYETILPLLKAEKDRLILICDTYIALTIYIEQTRATAEQLTDYDELICLAKGGTQGEPAPPFTGFQTLALPAGAFVGIIQELRDLRDKILAADNYTPGIGEDLMILAPKGTDKPDSEIIAAIKPEIVGGTYKIRIAGSLQGASAMRVEYLMKGGTVPQSFFLTKLPAEITVAPTVAGQPESGHLRAFLLENNEEIGQPSPDYPVTVG